MANSPWIKIWRLCLDAPTEQVASLRQILSEDEIVRADRFRGESLQHRFIVGRGVLRRILAGILRVLPQEISFVYNGHGRPAVSREQCRGTDYGHFNISHTGDLALVAVTNLATVGIDVEQYRKEEKLADLAQRFFSSGEFAEWQELPANQQVAGFFAIWTQKEAFIKAIGQGLSYPLANFTVQARPNLPARLLAIHDSSGDAVGWRLQHLELEPGYSATVAAPAGAWNCKVEDWF
ncbi:MAG: 4'-phosphopantetheinyl transferase superfamily protein [Pirellulales bacterium]|nr:4'-phosphopantetheinyl transferase superfamily protein [Pirellulales bacterium]